MDLKQYVSEVENWPKEGVSFKDITTIMDNGPAYKYATDQIVEYAAEKDVDIVVGPEARGFIIGCPVAYSMGIGFAPVRKKGKLPREVLEFEYDKFTEQKNRYSWKIREAYQNDFVEKGMRLIIERQNR